MKRFRKSIITLLVAATVATGLSSRVKRAAEIDPPSPPTMYSSMATISPRNLP